MPAQQPDGDALARLTRAARRAEADPFFFAHTLAAYRAQNGLDGAGLAQVLACSAAQLVQLALCRTPDTDAGRFRTDIEQIAASTGVDPLRIARLVRAVHAATALRHVAEEPVTYHLAARDHQTEGADEREDRDG